MKKSFDNVSATCAENKKITDRAMTTHMLACVIGIIVTAALLFTTTWAWFTTEAVSLSNSISSAYCTVDTIVDDSGVEVDYTEIDDSRIYSLKGGVTYTVKITASGTASGGYCKLSLDGATDEFYFTEVVRLDGSTASSPEGNTNSISFTISFTKDKTVTVRYGWGIHTHDDPELVNGGSYLYNETTGIFESAVTP